MLRKLAMKLGLKLLGREIKAAAEGKKGPKPEAIYRALLGKKTLVGVAMGAVAAGLAVLGDGGAATVVAGIGGLAVSVGLADKQWRSQVPYAATHWRWWKFLRDHSADIAAAIALGVGYTQACAPDAARILSYLHLSCSTATSILVVLGGASAWLLAEAKMAEAPLVPWRVEVPPEL